MKRTLIVAAMALLSLSVGAQTATTTQQKSVQKVQVKQGKPAVLKSKDGKKVIAGEAQNGKATATSKKTLKVSNTRTFKANKAASSSIKDSKKVGTGQTLEGNKKSVVKKQALVKGDTATLVKKTRAVNLQKKAVKAVK